jgi:aerobic carbon-monoxide dehydrogenase medium subunit
VNPASFEYERAGSLDEAVELLGSVDDAKVLAGGQSLIPILRLRFTRPSLVDVGRLADLRHTAVRARRGRGRGNR